MLQIVYNNFILKKNSSLLFQINIFIIVDSLKCIKRERERERN